LSMRVLESCINMLIIADVITHIEHFQITSVTVRLVPQTKFDTMQAHLMHNRVVCKRLHNHLMAAVQTLHVARLSCQSGAAAAAVAVKTGSSLHSASSSLARSRGDRCLVMAAVDEAAAGSPATQPQEAAEAVSSISTSDRFTEAEQQALWNSVSRALLRLGKTGATESHGRSLVELLAAHKLVKVQHNGCRGNPAALAAAATALQEQSAGLAELLHVKGSTLLFGSSSSTNEQLLAVAEASVASTAVWKTKRAAAAAERQQQRAVTEAKKVSNASRSRKRIGQMIRTVAKPGPVDKSSLVQEWQQLAGSIAAEEAGEGSSSGSSRRKAPWKK
jgi:RNA-binding protein YhbY